MLDNQIVAVLEGVVERLVARAERVLKLDPGSLAEMLARNYSNCSGCLQHPLLLHASLEPEIVFGTIGQRCYYQGANGSRHL